MATIGERFKNGWNAFLGRDPTTETYFPYYGGSSYQPFRRTSYTPDNRREVSAIYNRIAVDISMNRIEHVRLDQEGNFLEVIHDSLNYALTSSANIDQTGKKLIEDIAFSMFDEGVVAVVPVVTDINPKTSDSYKIYELRTGKILEWHPYHVRVEIYNQITGQKQTLMVEKRTTPIIENPFYSIMNESNSIAKQLGRIMGQINQLNGDTVSGKLDLIVQLPYSVRSPAKRKLASDRRADIEKQLTDSKYGVAYVDATEKIIQLNRSIENNLLEQENTLRTRLYNQLGLSESIFNGTANEAENLNYRNRIIEPALISITEEMERKWISKTARSQGQAIRSYQNPFRLLPINQFAEMADKVTRNEIMTSNEVRSAVGLIPSKDPKADELRNSNLNHPDEKELLTKKSNDIQNQ